MSFKTKTDYYGLSAINGIAIVSTNDNRSANTVEAVGEDGFVIATEVFAEKKAPTSEYVVTGNVNLSSITLGNVTEVENKKYVLSEIAIGTAAGSAPSFSVKGQQIEDGSGHYCVCKLPNIVCSGLHHAQTFGAFTLAGSGAHLTQCNYSATVGVSTVDKDGVTLAHDITNGRIVVDGTIQVSDSSYGVPTLALADGWVQTAPLAETNPDSDYPTYSFTLTKFLSAEVPA